MTECGTAAFDIPFQSISECVRIKTAVGKFLNHGQSLTFRSFQLPRCHSTIKRSCIDLFDEIDCRAALSFCDTQTGSAFWATGEQTCIVDGDLIILNDAQGGTYTTYPR